MSENRIEPSLILEGTESMAEIIRKGNRRQLIINAALHAPVPAKNSPTLAATWAVEYGQRFADAIEALDNKPEAQEK